VTSISGVGAMEAERGGNAPLSFLGLPIPLLAASPSTELLKQFPLWGYRGVQ
jgi:hypothetical protein